MPPTTDLMRSIIQRIATGPELSKDISREEARAGMRLILDGNADPVQAGIFLIALRMKRETDDEHLGILDAIRDVSTIVTAPVDEVVDIGDPYDGYVRSLPAAPFLPAVLAACGVPAVCHGVERMGPKYGLTHRQVLRAAGVAVDLAPADAAAHLGESGWAYLDQKAFCPNLYALAPLRSLIVKRPAITTVETGIGPIRGRKHTHLVTGFVHKPYPRIYALLARHAGFASALIVRGVEGGVIPSMRQSARFFYYHGDGELEYAELTPADFGMSEPLAPVPLPGAVSDETAEPAGVADTAAAAAAEAGRDALAGRASPVRDGLVLAAAACLWHLKRHPSAAAAANAVRAVLASGQALRRFEE